ncbi:MAG: DNA-binding protein [Methanomicrobiales archaeon]|nr:DNA-binding protein [Methanomicrobiales archaeon]
MQYSEGHLGRIFMVRLDDGEDILVVMDRFVVAQKIRAGMILFLGALREGRLVTGPEEPLIPPVPHFEIFGGGWEIFGMGTIYRGNDGKPMIHYHASVGRGTSVLTGCLRDKASTYLLVEVVLMEFTGIYGKRLEDPVSGVHMPMLKKEE